MALPIALILQLASVVPGLLKFAGAGTTAEKVAEQALNIAKQVTGSTDNQEAVSKIAVSGEAQNAFILESNKQMMSWDQMFLDDIANARARDIALAAAGKFNWMRFGLTAFAMITLTILMFFVMDGTKIDEWAQGVVLILIGRLAGYLDNIFNFEFGTTRSSQTKDATIDKLSNSGNGK